MAAALLESRKESIAKHLTKHTVTDNNVGSFRSLAVEAAVPKPQYAPFRGRFTFADVLAAIKAEADDAALGGITATAQGSTTDESTCCTICLEDYKAGDIVCRSKNGAIAGCFHKFHQDCITDWLMNHDDCSCCRTSFFHQKWLKNLKKMFLMLLRQILPPKINDSIFCVSRIAFFVHLTKL